MSEQQPSQPPSPSQDWVPADHVASTGGLRRKVAKGLTWSLLDNWGGQLLGLAILLILLRVLDADQVGLVALAAAIVGLAQLFVDQGLGDALIQRPSLTRREIDTAFWTAVATGSLLTVGGILLAGPLSALVGEPRLVPIIQALSFTFLLTAFSSIQIAILRREMRFGSLAARRLVAIAGGGAVGIAAALLGFGAWALVAQQLTQALISTVTLWAVSPWRPGFTAAWEDFRSLFGFGLNVVGGDLLLYLGRNADNLLVGAFLGPTALGFYAVGFRVLNATSGILVSAARELGFPTFSRLQHDRDRLRRAYGRMSRILYSVTLPGFIGLALVAEEAIVVLVGDRWRPSATIAAVLVLTGPAQTLQSYAGGLFNAIGRPDITLRYRLLTAGLNVGGFLVAVLVFRDALAVAVAYALRAYILAPVTLTWIQRYTGIPFLENVLRLRRIAAATLVMAVMVVLVKALVGGSMGPGVLLILEIAVGAAVYLATMLIIERDLMLDVWHFFLQGMPGRLRARLAGPRRAAS